MTDTQLDRLIAMSNDLWCGPVMALAENHIEDTEEVYDQHTFQNMVFDAMDAIAAFGSRLEVLISELKEAKPEEPRSQSESGGGRRAY